MWPPSLPEQPVGTRDSRLVPGVSTSKARVDPSVSYWVSAPCGPRTSLRSPEVPGSPIWTLVSVIRSVHCVGPPRHPLSNLEVPGSPVWTLVSVIRSVHHVVAARRYQGALFCPRCQLSGQCTVWAPRRSPSNLEVPGSPIWSPVSVIRSVHCVGPPSLPEQPGGTREPRLVPGVSYQVSTPCCCNPEVPGSPVWSPVSVIRSVHHVVATRRYQGAPFGPRCQLSGQCTVWAPVTPRAARRLLVH